MEDVKTMITDIKSKLDELEGELLQLEHKAVDDSGDVNTEAERHRLALQEVLTDLQQRIDEYHELADMDGAHIGDRWQQMDRDLMDLSSDLYGAN
ncbi:hypothetical protein [Alcanivorax sediminis]|uniref:Uncharacterized protein n=1 Tax=Alcanivorax sediminis TaxID=2663008 RepID=A0A6N7LTH8_9GAMM|nr:hypothetical protein [Alcanivorax sediminis]MQX52484.1 hypothetical protein [Alcanivorax sediminis]